MNSNTNMSSSVIELEEKETTGNTTTDAQNDVSLHQNSDEQVSHPIVTSSSAKRQKDISPCRVCGAKAHGYNFDQITCESCKAFFRRNALKPMEKFRCRNNNNCVITVNTRKRCKRCRITKCFTVGMRKDWILTEEEKREKRKKIIENRASKKQAQLVRQQRHPSNEFNYLKIQTNTSPSSSMPIDSSSSDSQYTKERRVSECFDVSLPMMCMYNPLEKQLYIRHQCLIHRLSDGYQAICRQYPQPKRFTYFTTMISQTMVTEEKLDLLKTLTKELTQMTTSRLLNYFSLVPEFGSFTESEQRSILIKNMLTVFMFHGALTYNPETNVFVDRTTGDQPYDAKYLLWIYGPRIHDIYISLARRLALVTYQAPNDRELDGQAHVVFLLLMVILLFSEDFESGFEICAVEHEQRPAIASAHNRSTTHRSLPRSTESLSPTTSSSLSSSLLLSSTHFNEKLSKIQQSYVELTCRYLHDTFGLTVGRQMFQALIPLLHELRQLCATLANASLCEFAEDRDRLASSRTTTPSITAAPDSQIQPTQSDSSIISERTHLDELQKENRAPSDLNNY